MSASFAVNDRRASPAQRPGSLADNRYSLRLARTRREIEPALRLRFEVFNLELHEGFAESFVTGLDEDEFDRVCELAKTYGAALVIGSIDEDKEASMARTADRKLAIALRGHERATKVHGLAPEDLLFDPLVLPISTGMEADRRSALETIEGVRRIAAALPECQTTVGLSNVSSWFDRTFVDGAVNGLGSVFQAAFRGMHRAQTGRTQNYALTMAVGIFGFVCLYLLLK